MIELKPCPDCKSRAIGTVSVDLPFFNKTMFFIGCYECGCRTQLFAVRPSAVDAWNAGEDLYGRKKKPEALDG